MNSTENLIREREYENLTLDLRLIHQLNFRKEQQRISAPKNIRQLGYLMKARNAKYNFTKQDIDKGQQWMKKKGTDVKSLIDKIRVLKQAQQKKKQQKKSEQDCYFYFPHINIQNQDEYLSKNAQFGIFKCVQSAMTNQNLRKNITRKLINNIRKVSIQDQKYVGVGTLSSHIRNKEKQQKYRATVIKLASRFQEQRRHQLNYIAQFRDKVNLKLWEILYEQIRYVDYDNPENIVPLMIGSLKMVESQFGRYLPKSYQGISNYISSQYLNKLVKNKNDKYSNEGNNSSFWGIAFMLYRAGNKNQFASILKINQQDQLAKQFKIFDSSIDQLRPQPSTGYWSQNNYDDIFYEQLLFILKGVPKYSSQVIADLMTLDFIWIILKTLGINIQIPESKGKLNEIKQKLFQTYSMDLNETKISNMCYLLGYYEIILYGPNQYIDTDDYLHLLICLYNYSSLVLGNQLKIRKKLTERLTSYIYELILENASIQTYSSYMLMFPKQDLVEEVSTIIASSNLFQANEKKKEINCQFFKQKLSLDTYQKLITRSLDKYISLHKKYLLVAKKYDSLLHDGAKALDILVDMFIKAISETKLSKSQILNAQTYFQILLKRDKSLQQKYSPLLELFKQNRLISQAIIYRKYQDISTIIENTPFRIRGGQITNSFRVMFEELLKRKVLDKYFFYLDNMLRGFQQLAIHSQRLDSAELQLQKIQKQFDRTIQIILKQQRASQYSNAQAVKKIRAHLNATMEI